MVVAVFATVAGAPLASAARLGLAMTALQASIGALNDIVDAPADAGRKPGKPIPAGLVGLPAAGAVVSAGALGGVVLAAGSGMPTAGVAVLVLGVGFAYDLRFKGTPWSFVPFAVGIPLLPVFAWIGASGTLPSWFLALVPCAVLAGSALAVANALADLERDRSSGTGSIATELGHRRAWRVQLALHAIVVGVALATLALAGGSGLALAGSGAAGAVLLTGALLARTTSPAARERAWQVQAIATAALAAAWVFAMHDAP